MPPPVTISAPFDVASLTNLVIYRTCKDGLFLCPLLYINFFGINFQGKSKIPKNSKFIVPTIQ